MPQIRRPRRGTMQLWPRRRSKRVYARVRSWATSKDAKPLGFAGYKVGMTHLIINNNHKNATTKGMDISCPVTIIECPPIKAASIRFYKNTLNGAKTVSQITADNLDKELDRKLILPKNKSEQKVPEDYDYIHLVVYTQPKLTGIGKKKPEVFEVAVGGSKEDQLKYAQEKLGKEIAVSEVFKEGEQLDMHAVTKGKGVQGPVRRFGIAIRRHKSEKSVRNPGSLGGWIQQGHTMWRQAKAGKMGFHMRTEFNKWIIKIGEAAEIKRKGGHEHFGDVKNTYIMVKGSIAGPHKRIVRFNAATRPSDKIPTEAPQIKYTNITVEK